MKKILAMLVAVTMILSMGSLVAFASDDSITLSLEIVAEPATQGAVGNPTEVGQVFEVAVVASDFTTDKIYGANEVRVTWDVNALEVVRPKADGFDAAADNSGYIAGIAKETKDEYGDIEGGYMTYKGVLNAAEGWYDITQYLDPGNPAAPAKGGEGYPISEAEKAAGKVTLWSIRFRVKATGNTGLTISKENLALKTCEPMTNANIIVKPTNITIGETTADKEVTGLAGDPIVVNSVDELPNPIKVNLVGGETADVTVEWDTTAVVDGEGTATAKLPAGYKYQDGVAAITATVTKPAPTDKEVTGLAGDPIVVNSVDELPNPIKVNLVGGETADVTVEWDTTAVVDGQGTATAKLPAGYKYQDGVAAITATVKKPDVSENKVVESVQTQLPTSAADVNELPSQLEVTLDDGTQATVDVVWEYKEGVIVGKIVSEGYEAAPELKIAVDLKDESELPAAIVVGEVTAAPNGGITVPVSVQYNAEYVGDMLDKYGDDAQVALVYFAYKWENNKKVPVINGVSQEGTSFSLAMLKNDGVAKDFVINGVDADEVQFSLVLDFNWADVLSGTNYGSPIALGQSAAFPAAE